MVKRACSQEHNLKTLYPRHHIKLNIVIYDIKKSFFCIVFVINVKYLNDAKAYLQMLLPNKMRNPFRKWLARWLSNRACDLLVAAPPGVWVMFGLWPAAVNGPCDWLLDGSHSDLATAVWCENQLVMMVMRVLFELNISFLDFYLREISQL